MGITLQNPSTHLTSPLSATNIDTGLARKEEISLQLAAIAPVLREAARELGADLVVRYPLASESIVFELQRVIEKSSADNARVSIDPWLPRPKFGEALFSLLSGNEISPAYVMDLVKPEGKVPPVVHTVQGAAFARYLMVVPWGTEDTAVLVDIESRSFYGPASVADRLPNLDLHFGGEKFQPAHRAS